MKSAPINKSIQKVHTWLNKPITRAELLRYLAQYGACGEAVVYVESFKNPEDAWNKCERFDWMEWLICSLNERNQDELMSFVSDTFYEAYANYEGWGNMRANWTETCTVKERKQMKKMAQELRLFIPWSYMEKRFRMIL